MSKPKLEHDPFNLIITGVGGQGNVLASRLVGDILSRQGLEVTIGETFGASQRGGSVMSHLRAATGGGLSPQIPKGQARMVVSLEPTEAIRVLRDYGNPEVQVITSLRPVQSLGVICGEQTYPGQEEIKSWIRELSARAWFLDPTREAIKLGNPILANVILVGALAGTGALPLDRAGLEAVLAQRMGAGKVAANLKAYDLGLMAIKA